MDPELLEGLDFAQIVVESILVSQDPLKDAWNGLQGMLV